MRNEKIAAAIRAETERQRAKRRSPVSVAGRVRLHLNEIIEARPETTWDGIASALSKSGITWANGNPLTGRQLRNIVSRLLISPEENKQPAPPPSPEPKVFSPLVVPSEKKSPDNPVETSRPSAGNKDGKTRIMDEIMRASSERK